MGVAPFLHAEPDMGAEILSTLPFTRSEGVGCLMVSASRRDSAFRLSLKWQQKQIKDVPMSSPDAAFQDLAGFDTFKSWGSMG